MAFVTDAEVSVATPQMPMNKGLKLFQERGEEKISYFEHYMLMDPTTEAINNILDVFHNLVLVSDQQQEALEQLRQNHKRERTQSIRNFNAAQAALRVAHQQELSEQLDRLASGISRTRSVYRRRQEELFTYLEETHIHLHPAPQQQLVDTIWAQQRRPPIAVLDIDDSDEENPEEQGEENGEDEEEAPILVEPPVPEAPVEQEPVRLDPQFAAAIIEAQQQAAIAFQPVPAAEVQERNRVRPVRRIPPAHQQIAPQAQQQVAQAQNIQAQPIRVGSYVRLLNSCRLARQGTHYHVHGTVTRIGAVYYTIRVWNYAINRNEEFRRQRHNIRPAVRPQGEWAPIQPQIQPSPHHQEMGMTGIMDEGDEDVDETVDVEEDEVEQHDFKAKNTSWPNVHLSTRKTPKAILKTSNC